MTETLEFRALGSFEVFRDGDPIDLGPHKQRSLLALLLINANRVVSTGRITEALWGPDASDKQNALWVYISRLRTVLEPERSGRGESSVLVTKDPGYMLTVDPEEVDLLRFERSLDSARALLEPDTERALAHLSEAVDSWRGDALADFTYEAFARAEIDRLDELRLEALELMFDARLRLGHAAELTSGLERLARENPFRERPVAQLMTALYRAGRQAEALRAFERYRRTLAEELGIEPSPELRRLEEQVLLHDEKLVASTRTVGRDVHEARNPYKGLHAFQETDAPDFFGRETLVAELLRRLDRGDRLLALVGPSGSGKSSAVRAGLIPHVRKGGVTGRSEWLIAQMVPGAHPFAELEAALLRTRLDAPDSLSDQLADGDHAILRAALRVLPGNETRLLLVIDQFEELFTLVDDRDVQRQFLDGLLLAVDDPHKRVTVVVTLRADFYDRPLLHPAFGARLGDALVNVMPLSSHELDEAASQPAAMAGVAVEASLLGRLIADVVDHPGALPMFQYTLTELYERRAGDVLREAGYDEIGGVRGAITHRAEDLFDDLGPEEQEAARQLFLRLVSMSGEDTWSRRRVRAEEITSLDVDVVALQAVIDRFGSRRLLFFDRDRATGAPTVEVGHEALLTEWERLETWIREARHDLLRHGAFVAAVDDWVRSDRDPGYLVTGTRLAEYEKWAGSSRIELNARELQFLGAGIEARQAELRADGERTEREARLAGRARRRLWAAVAAVVVLTILVGAFIVVSVLRDTTRVALVTNGLDDAQNELLLWGVKQAAAKFPIEIVEVKPPITDLTQVYRGLAETGVKLIIVPGGFDLGDVHKVAGELPDVTFVPVMGFPDLRNSNVVPAVFAEEEGGFLAGVAAASETKTGVVGFVGGMPAFDVHQRRAGFEAGVASVDTSIAVIARHITANGDVDRAFQRVDLGKAAAADLFARGADVVYHAAGRAGLGVFQAAREHTEATGVIAYGIGSDSDQFLEAGVLDQDYVLMSVLRMYEVVANNSIRDFMGGEFEPGVVVYTLADGGLGYSERGRLSKMAKARIDQAKADIISGAIAVPEVPAGDVLPPLGTPEPAGTVKITYDGMECTHRFDGSRTVTPGQSLRIVMVNNSELAASAFVWPSEFRSFASVVPTEPGTTRTGYVVATSGSYVFTCAGSDTELMRIEVTDN
jgi:basic membrane lipoprotein Med (substrate-binding protein (PBP1-ABC) superfamily)/DNA-binding SARP family transcriptional activator